VIGGDPPAASTHAIGPQGDARWVLTALVLIAGFLVAEAVSATLSGSLALFADAGHMLSDVAALTVTMWAMRLSKRPPQGPWTYGLKRAEILSAAVNGVILVAVGLLIGAEAIQRLVTPHQVAGGVLLWVAMLGAIVNVAASWALARADRSSLNIRGAYLHVVTDLFAFVATGAAGVVILVTGWERADAVASLVVVALISRAAWRLLRDSSRILLQGAPEDVDLGAVRSHLSQVPHVLDVHDLHAWTISSGQPTLSVHVVVDEGCFEGGFAPKVLDALQRCIAGHFDVEHATFQLEPAAHLGHEGRMHP
jgi:cobalt-zinc-cadmium efflux system protein